MIVKKLAILIIFFLFINIYFTSCDIWMKPMVPFIEEATSVYVTFIHPDDDSEIIVKTHFNKKITPPDISKGGYEIKWYNVSSNRAWKFETDIANEKYMKFYGEWIISLNIGEQGPGGGIIFYKNEPGFEVQMINPAENYIAHYLEAAPVDWDNAGGTDPLAPWGITATLIDDVTTTTTTSTEIGNGRKDTQLIVAHYGAGTYAAQMANDFDNGQDDWFLPSLGELYLYAQSAVPDNPARGNYWSSSQRVDIYGTTALSWNFNSTVPYFATKTNNLYVRPIRAF